MIMKLTAWRRGQRAGGERERGAAFIFFFVFAASKKKKKKTRRAAMASPAPSPRGTPSTLKDRSSEPLGDQQTTESCAVASEQEEQQRTTSPSRSSMLLLFVPAAAAATVSPLPPRVASRWSSEGGVSSIATQDSIDARLVAAEAKRQASF